MGFSATSKNAMLDARFGSGAPATYYAAVYVSGVEVSGNGYARVAITNNVTNFPAAAAGVQTNGTEIAWPQATGGNWGLIDEVRLHTHITNEAVEVSDTVSKQIDDGDILRIEAGALNLSLTDPA